MEKHILCCTDHERMRVLVSHTHREDDITRFEPSVLNYTGLEAASYKAHDRHRRLSRAQAFIVRKIRDTHHFTTIHLVQKGGPEPDAIDTELTTAFPLAIWGPEPSVQFSINLDRD
jgi:hypothetical protein